MHELGIAQDLFKIIKEKAKKNDLKKVTKISIKVGRVSGIEGDLLKHTFIDHMLPGTIAEGAELELIKETPEVKCKNCGKEPDIQEEFSTTCPACGSFDVEVIKGKDIYLESIEGET